MMRLALAPTIIFTATGTAEDSAYPASNLTGVTRPDRPAKTTATGAQTFTLEFAGSTTVIALAIGYANVASVTVAGSAPITLAPNPGNGRYGVLYEPASPIVASSIPIAIPSQDTVDGASVYRIGYVWPVLAWETWPRDFRWDFDPTPEDALEDWSTGSKRRQRILRGPEFMRLAGERQAVVGRPSLFSDEVAASLVLERRWMQVDAGLVSVSSHPYWFSVMRQVARPRWKVGPTVAESSFEWEEITGP